ncbi:N-formylglutamate deformylase [Rhizobium sp. Rhizsp42]|uniref:N-formylglutamate deformylase n=1 Tax=Rhizobium sp. Rhizsp42 TaxID=3243034 RepID=UPI000DBA1564
MTTHETRQGTSPIILGFPHTGTDVPPAIWDRLNDNGKLLADTDWHIHNLYDGLLDGVTTVRATFHRYVIDANRDPSGTSLYPGQNTTGLVPDTDFDGLSIWKEGAAPNEVDITERLRDFHAPYHAALAAEIERVKAIHGVAILYDCHSIRSHIPFLFEGKLPDFNIGTDMGKTCAVEFERVTAEIAGYAAGYTSIVNGRFKGGWTTRHYGQPANCVHAIQMELAQSAYLETEQVPFAYDEEKATALRTHLKTILARIETAAHELKAMGN